jgi:hypothetical protein
LISNGLFAAVGDSVENKITFQSFEIYGETIRDLISYDSSKKLDDFELEQCATLPLNSPSDFITIQQTIKSLKSPNNESMLIYRFWISHTISGISTRSKFTIIKCPGSECYYGDREKLHLAHGRLVATTAIAPYLLLDNTGFHSKSDYSIAWNACFDEICGNCESTYIITFDPSDSRKSSVNSLDLISIALKAKNISIMNTKQFEVYTKKMWHLIAKNSKRLPGLIFNIEDASNERVAGLIARLNSVIKESSKIEEQFENSKKDLLLEKGFLYEEKLEKEQLKNELSSSINDRKILDQKIKKLEEIIAAERDIQKIEKENSSILRAELKMVFYYLR